MNKPRFFFRQHLIILLLIFIFIISCGRQKIRSDIPVEERLKIAIKMFDKRDFFDAKTQFRIITLSFSGNTLADKAQFYLAECHFYLKEYIISASEYERLIKVYPGSEYVDDAKYKLGLSYYELSPKSSLDQEYTIKAITEFQEFLEDYYSSSLVPEVEGKLLEAKNKLAQKTFDAADQYRKMSYYTAAIIYFSKVLENYYDSIYAPQAQYWLGECYRKLDNLTDARDAFNMFVKKYPKHEMIGKVRKKLQEVVNELDKQKENVTTK